MERWNELLTAYQVGRLGTFQAAAKALGLHRATVARHIDALEDELGARLFLRNPKGAHPTDAGEDLLRTAAVVEEQLAQLALRLRGRDAHLSGELVLTSVEAVSALVLPAVAEFRLQHPAISVRYEVSPRLYQLEYGEAHVAIRSGAKPRDPDCVATPFTTMKLGLYAHERYVAHNGLPASKDAYGEHTFIGTDGPDRNFPFMRWLHANVPAEALSFTSASRVGKWDALLAGVGIGFYPKHLAGPELHPVGPPEREWRVPFWIVTHVDLHRSPKVQAFLRILREGAV
ncbi:MAG: LysR family transcriptional regulator [Myxococcota bacterium]